MNYHIICTILTWLLLMTVPSTAGKTPYNEIIAKCNCELPSQVIHDVNVLLLEGIKIVASSAASKRVLFIGDSTVRGLFLSILRAASQNSQLSSPFQVWYRKCPRCGGSKEPPMTAMRPLSAHLTFCLAAPSATVSSGPSDAI